MAGPQGFDGARGATGPRGFQGLPAAPGQLCLLIEASDQACGIPLSGPLQACDGDKLRFWSKGGIFTEVTQGSVLVEIEPNNLTVGVGPPTKPPKDSSRPAFYHNSVSRDLYFWDPTIGVAGEWVNK